MKGQIKLMVIILSVMTWLADLSSLAIGFSGGPRLSTSELNASCAICHAMPKVEYAPERGAAAATAQLIENKHYKDLEAGSGEYSLIPADKRKALLEQVKWVDQNSSISLNAPVSTKPGQMVEVTVEAKGGIGPYVGVFLGDVPLRYLARSIAFDGWYFVDAPKVIGPDGKEQTWWLEQRKNQKKNVSFLLVQAKADVEKKTLPTTKITWTLRAPVDPGTYTMTAGFLYGTEEPDEFKTGKLELAPGGYQGKSGRVLFSEPVTVTVQ
jgi:hypothetical protein